MKKYEKEDISKLPPQFKPMGAWAYFGYSILFAIPIIGYICLIIFSFNSSNINRRSFARSFFCGMLVFICLLIIALVICIVMGIDLLAYIKSLIPVPMA